MQSTAAHGPYRGTLWVERCTLLEELDEKGAWEAKRALDAAAQRDDDHDHIE